MLTSDTDLQITDLWSQQLRYVISNAGRSTELLAGVDIAVTSGQITGILGPNGAGKSTLLQLLIGALTPSDGQLWIGEAGRRRSLPALPARERARRLAYVEQDGHPHEDLTVAEVVALGRLPYQSRFATQAPWDGQVTDQAMVRTGTTQLANRAFATLSGGERQRVHLARALAQTPRVLLLDEPANHLDLRAQLDLLQVIHSVASGGAGVLVALHDLAMAADLCDQVVVLDAGRVAAAGVPRQVLTPALIEHVWGVGAEWVQGRSGSALVFRPLD